MLQHSWYFSTPLAARSVCATSPGIAAVFSLRVFNVRVNTSCLIVCDLDSTILVLPLKLFVSSCLTLPFGMEMCQAVSLWHTFFTHKFWVHSKSAVIECPWASNVWSEHNGVKLSLLWQCLAYISAWSHWVDHRSSFQCITTPFSSLYSPSSLLALCLPVLSPGMLHMVGTFLRVWVCLWFSGIYPFLCSLPECILLPFCLSESNLKSD